MKSVLILITAMSLFLLSVNGCVERQEPGDCNECQYYDHQDQQCHGTTTTINYCTAMAKCREYGLVGSASLHCRGTYEGKLIDAHADRVAFIINDQDKAIDFCVDRNQEYFEWHTATEPVLCSDGNTVFEYDIIYKDGLLYEKKKGVKE